MSGNTRSKTVTAIVLALLAFSVIGAALVLPKPVHAASYCGPLGEYTTWHWAGWTHKGWKPILFVWKNGAGKPNPQISSIKYQNQDIALGNNTIDTGAPQVDLNNGWVGYYLDTTWSWGLGDWNDDSRWDVTGCVE